MKTCEVPDLSFTLSSISTIVNLNNIMKPYGYPKLRGLSGRRRSTDTPHRRRCLRVDKKRSRRYATEVDCDNLVNITDITKIIQ